MEAEQILKIKGTLVTMYAQMTGQTRERILSDLDRDNYMSAQQASAEWSVAAPTHANILTHSLETRLVVVEGGQPSVRPPAPLAVWSVGCPAPTWHHSPPQLPTLLSFNSPPKLHNPTLHRNSPPPDPKRPATISGARVRADRPHRHLCGGTVRTLSGAREGSQPRPVAGGEASPVREPLRSVRRGAEQRWTLRQGARSPR